MEGPLCRERAFGGHYKYVTNKCHINHFVCNIIAILKLLFYNLYFCILDTAT